MSLYERPLERLALERKRRARAPVPTKTPEETQEDEPEERRKLCCRVCESEISDTRALFCMRATSPIQVFPNPYGILRAIVTLRFATGLTFEGPPTDHFTWFAGYAWEIAYCGACRHHLGWSYDAIADEDPKRFFGLLKNELVER